MKYLRREIQVGDELHSTEVNNNYNFLVLRTSKDVISGTYFYPNLIAGSQYNYLDSNMFTLGVDYLKRYNFIFVTTVKTWEPEEDDDYWYIDSDGDVCSDNYSEESKADVYRKEVGNMFKTEKEAEQYTLSLVLKEE